jgi:hypothetical protein
MQPVMDQWLHEVVATSHQLASDVPHQRAFGVAMRGGRWKLFQPQPYGWFLLYIWKQVIILMKPKAILVESKLYSL